MLLYQKRRSNECNKGVCSTVALTRATNYGAIQMNVSLYVHRVVDYFILLCTLHVSYVACTGVDDFPPAPLLDVLHLWVLVGQSARNPLTHIDHSTHPPTHYPLGCQCKDVKGALMASPERRLQLTDDDNRATAQSRLATGPDVCRQNRW